MPAPVISWYDSGNTTQQTSVDFGVVDAGSVSAIIRLLIWNNRGGASAVSDATGCVVTTKDTSGGNTGDVVVERWEEAQDNKEATPAFVAIGGTTSRPVAANPAAAPQVIKGTANDGTTANSPNNFADVSFQWRVPSTATAGQRNWLTRLFYNYA